MTPYSTWTGPVNSGHTCTVHLLMEYRHIEAHPRVSHRTRRCQKCFPRHRTASQRSLPAVSIDLWRKYVLHYVYRSYRCYPSKVLSQWTSLQLSRQWHWIAVRTRTSRPERRRLVNLWTSWSPWRFENLMSRSRWAHGIQSLSCVSVWSECQDFTQLGIPRLLSP